MAWQEQVKLQNGEVIVVARTARFKENWVAGGGGGSFNKGMSVQMVQPARGSNPTTWEGRFVPMLLDRDPANGEWAIVATFFHCESWYELGRPKLPYTEYRFISGRWTQRPLSDVWIGRQSNLLPADLSDREAIAESKFSLSVERKIGIMNNPAVPQKYKQIISRWSSGC